MASGANDIVVVRQTNGDLRATPVNVQIGEKVCQYMTVVNSGSSPKQAWS